MTEAWDQVVSDRAGKQRGGERELRAVFVLGTIIAGTEAGFELPAVSFAISFMWMMSVGMGGWVEGLQSYGLDLFSMLIL